MAYLSALHPLDKLLLRMIAYDTVLGVVIAEIIFIPTFLSDLEVWSRDGSPINGFILGFGGMLFVGAFIGCFVGMFNGFFTGIATHFCMKYGNIPYYRRVVMAIAVIFTSLFVFPIVVIASSLEYNKLVFVPAGLVGFVIVVGIVVYASQHIATLYLREVDMRKSKIKPHDG